ncbi:MAG: trypsin-like peptidase domain-containing protein [Flavobacteriaceae bacterium]
MKKILLPTLCLLLLNSAAFSQAKKIIPTEYPYAYVVKLLMHKNGGTFHGTGIMINKNSIITNAHNVQGKDSISIYPGYSKKNNSPFGKITVKSKLNENIFYPKEYKIDSLNRFYDYAVIKFENEEVYKKVLEKSNNKKFEIELVENLDSKTINISGYPFFRFFEFWKPRKARVQYHNSTKKFKISEKILLNYKLNTRGGSSGSPLWVEKDGKLIVIGIHKSGKGFNNQGIYYNEERVKQIKEWMEK